MRVMLKHQAVFTGAGLALIAVAPNIFRLRRRLRHEAPFHPRGKSRSAAPALARGLDFIHNGVRLHAERLLHGLVTVQFEEPVEVGRTLAEAPGDDFYLVGMGNQVSHGTLCDCATKSLCD